MNVPIERDRRYTLEEYFRLSEASDETLEYHDGFIVPLGELIAMSEVCDAHSLLVANVVGELRAQLRGTPCRVYGGGLPVRIAQSSFIVHPDVCVICGATQYDAQPSAKSVVNPKLVVEVVSVATESHDRGEKLNQYIRVDSIEEYVLISQSTARLDVYKRLGDGSWLFRSVQGLDQVVRLGGVGVELLMREIFAGVVFPPESEEQTA